MKKKIKILLWSLSLISLQQKSLAKDKRFVVVSASYNNERWCRWHLASIFNQTYKNWHLIYINDCSTDKTGSIVSDLIEQSGVSEKITYIENKQRVGHLSHQFNAIHTCNNHDVIIILDGDDWFASNTVLTFLNEVYQDDSVWLTYGSYKPYKVSRFSCFAQPILPDIIKNNTIRLSKWCLSHLRTFYAGLFKKIEKEDLLFHGNFYPVAADVATMIPMAEMAGENFKFIPNTLMIYNNANSLNLFKNHKKELLRKKCLAHIRSAKPYAPLREQPF